jgi:hypothetical protein
MQKAAENQSEAEKRMTNLKQAEADLKPHEEECPARQGPLGDICVCTIKPGSGSSGSNSQGWK